MHGRDGGPGKRVESDPQLRAELDLCDRWGIPHSHFLGGPDEWTEADRAKALAYKRWVAERCKECSTAQAEWDEAQGGHQHAYIADVIRCHGCERIEEALEQVPNDQHGIKAILIPRELVEDAVT